MSNEEVRVKLTIPGQEDQFIEIPIENEYPTESLEFCVSKTDMGRVSNNEGTRIWCVSFLHEDTREHNPTKSFMATCGGRFIYIHLVTEILTFYQKYMDNSQPKEDFYTVAWGVTADNEVLLAAGGRKGQITIINTQIPKVLYHLCGHTSEINELKFQPTNGAFLLSCSNDYSLRLWNVRTRVQIAIFYGISGHIAPVLTVHWHSEGGIVLSGGMDSTVKLWGLEPLATVIEQSTTWDPQIKMVQKLPCAKTPFKTALVRNCLYSTGKVHRSFVDCARFFGNLVISKGQEGVIVVWKPDDSLTADGVTVLFTIQCPQEFPELKMRFSIDYKNELLAVGGARSDIFIYKLGQSEPSFLHVEFNANQESFVRDVGFTHNNRVIGADDFCYILIATLSPVINMD